MCNHVFKRGKNTGKICNSLLYKEGYCIKHYWIHYEEIEKSKIGVDRLRSAVKIDYTDNVYIQLKYGNGIFLDELLKIKDDKENLEIILCLLFFTNVFILLYFMYFIIL